MNATGNASGFLGSNNTGGFGFGVGVSVAILLLITSITMASYFCTRSRPPPSSAAHEGRRNVGHAVPPPDLPNFVIDVGLDEEIINSYPKLPYSEAKALHKTNPTSSSCCSICLADYKATDLLRQLPDCGHLFHVKCVDPLAKAAPDMSGLPDLPDPDAALDSSGRGGSFGNQERLITWFGKHSFQLNLASFFNE